MEAPSHLSDGASIYPALQNFLLAVRAHGLGAVVTGWFVMAERDLRAHVGIPDDWQLAALIPVGHPEGRHGPLKRKPVQDVTDAERWDQRAW
jgi:nitroreductase